eukprot:4773555-Prymnesium_polylepis.1
MQEAMQEAPGAMQRSSMQENSVTHQPPPPVVMSHPTSTSEHMRNLEREVKQEARFAYNETGHALYSAAAGALWGDHEPPRTRRGSIALLGYGFV